MSQSVEEAKGCTVYAAFNPETGECMTPTVAASKEITRAERDRFYKGCPIHECQLSPMHPIEDVNFIAKEWPR